MRWLNAALLLILGTILAAGNLWISAARSTIPLSLNDIVERVEIRHEKHPGKDDVYLVHLRSGRTMHMDQAVATALFLKGTIQKQSWERHVRVKNRIVNLDWSADARGMFLAMPAIMLILLATSIWVCWQRREAVN